MLTSARATLVHSEHGLAGPRACGGHKLAQQGASYSLLLHSCVHTHLLPQSMTAGPRDRVWKAFSTFMQWPVPKPTLSMTTTALV